MATTRILATIGAASIAGLAIVYAPAHARENCTSASCRPAKVSAPLNLLPSAPRSSRSSRAAASPTAAKRIAGKKRATARKTSRHAARRQTAPVRRAAGSAPAPREPHDDNVLRGANSVSLIAMLPWWRANRMQTIHYLRAKEAESQVLAAADAWVAQYTPSGTGIVGDNNRPRIVADKGAGSADAGDGADEIEIVDAGELNAIDLAASGSRPPEKTFLQSLIAMLGGAAVAAYAARFLFV